MNTEYTKDEIEEMDQQTGRIAANLKQIEESAWSERRLQELDEQTGRIVVNLKKIDDGPYDHQSQLNAMDATTDNISDQIGSIEAFLDSIGDLDTLEAKLDRILAKLKQVEESGDDIS